MGRKSTKVELHGKRYTAFTLKYSEETVNGCIKKAFELFLKFKSITDGDVDKVLKMIPPDRNSLKIAKAKPMVEDELEAYAKWLRKEINPNYRYSSMANNVNPVIWLYKSFDMDINEKRITPLYYDKKVGKRRLRLKGYTLELIEVLYEASLNDGDQRSPLIVLTYTTTGMRRGALPVLQYGHFRWYEEWKQYVITVYGDPESEIDTNDVEYDVPLSPQLSALYKEYFDQRERDGEVLTFTSPAIREEYNKEDKNKWKLRAIKDDQIFAILQRLRVRTGITTYVKGKKTGTVRSEIPAIQGFRYSFTSIAELAEKDGFKAKWNKIFKGHKVDAEGLKTVEGSNYMKRNDIERLEAYKPLIPYFSFGKEGRLQKELIEKEAKLKKTEAENAELLKMKEDIEALKNDHLRNIPEEVERFIKVYLAGKHPEGKPVTDVRKDQIVQDLKLWLNDKPLFRQKLIELLVETS